MRWRRAAVLYLQPNSLQQLHAWTTILSDARCGGGAADLLRRAGRPSRGKLVVRRPLQLGLEGLAGGDRRRAVAARALLMLAEDPIRGVEVGALVVLVDEGLLGRNPSILALQR